MLRTILYTPMLLSMGIGMCISNAKAVFEGLTTRGGEFVRTPKYDVTGGRGMGVEMAVSSSCRPPTAIGPRVWPRLS